MVRVVLIRLHSKSVLLDIDIIPDGDSFLVVKGRWLLRVVVIRRKKGVGVVRKTRCKVVVCVCLLLWWWWSGSNKMCRIEVPEVDNLGVFRETIELMFENEDGVTKRLLNIGVFRSIDILEVRCFPTLLYFLFIKHILN